MYTVLQNYISAGRLEQSTLQSGRLEPKLLKILFRLVQLWFACGKLLFIGKGSTMYRTGFQPPSGYLLLEYRPFIVITSSHSLVAPARQMAPTPQFLLRGNSSRYLSQSIETKTQLMLDNNAKFLAIITDNLDCS